MPVKNIVTGQKVMPAKLQRARELRQVMTAEEKILWQALRKGQLGGFHFRRQQIIGGFIVDFYCHASDLVIEVDGLIHLSQKEYDTDRDSLISGYGLRIYHFSNQQIMQQLPDVLKIILAACREKNPTAGSFPEYETSLPSRLETPAGLGNPSSIETTSPEYETSLLSTLETPAGQDNPSSIETTSHEYEISLLSTLETPAGQDNLPSIETPSPEGGRAGWGSGKQL
jgi:very-short-patch-repair endonuclease